MPYYEREAADSFIPEGRFNTEDVLDDEGDHEFHPLYEELNDYLNSLYARVHPDLDLNQIKPLVERFKKSLLAIIDENNLVEQISHSERFVDIKNEHKKQRGKCVIGICQCIDGRCSIPHTIGQIGSVWETKAGILKSEKSPIDHKVDLESSRLQESISDRARKGRPLLEVLFAHTSLSNPDEGCGAMKERLARGDVPDEITDLVLENLRLHQRSAKIIDQIYNRNVTKKEDELEKVAITGVFDTDTMGYVFGYENAHEAERTGKPAKGTLSTTELTREFEQDIEDAFIFYPLEPIAPGFFRNDFHTVDNIIPQEELMLDINRFLFANPEFIEKIDDFLDENHPDLVEDQRQAFRYLVTRKVSSTYLNGLHRHKEIPDHPFSEHGEDYQAISLDGITLGQYDPEHQVFGASPASAEEAVEHVVTQCELMDTIGKVEKPYKLFLSRTSSINGNMNNERGILRKTFLKLLHNKTIMGRVRDGELVVIPILIDSKTRQVVEIPNFGR